MLYYLLKTAIAAILIVLVAEVSKRNVTLGALLASLPIISLLAILFLYFDTHNTLLISKLCTGVLWLVLASLVFFICLPILLKWNINFFLSLGISLSIMTASYFIMLGLLRWFET